MNNFIDFKNQLINELPADESDSKMPRQVENACFSLVNPTKTADPQVICISNAVAKQFNFNDSELASDDFKKLFSGNLLLENMKPYAMCYGGHQFGHWAGQLGDGRAINLGEVLDNNGCIQTLQLKGAGLTPYSRTADGLAVLRSSVREFLCSEAMYYLGISTTRALSLSLTGDQVMRDMFYDGNAAFEKGAVVCRVSQSFIRFGNFQIHASRNETKILKQLMDFTISQYFPHLGSPNIKVYEQWFEEVCQSTAELMVDWMRVGFVHGVMNTDNMSILSQTIDYGPYGWLENYDPEWTPNTTDAEGRRYSYGNQPQIAQWNLFQLANALLPVIGRAEVLEKSLASFSEQYEGLSHAMYCRKLGLVLNNSKIEKELINEIFLILQQSELDMTLFFRCLSKLSMNATYSEQQLINHFKSAFYNLEKLKTTHSKNVVSLIKWLRKYLLQIAQQKLSDEERKKIMNQTNPKYILRNYLVQVAIDKADLGDYSEIEKLLNIMKKPYDEQEQYESYAARRPDWAKNKAGCSMLSCSS